MFWIFVTVLVVAGYVYKLKKIELQARLCNRLPEKDVPLEVLQRLEKMERRLANLETIVLESEKHREFERRL